MMYDSNTISLLNTLLPITTALRHTLPYSSSVSISFPRLQGSNNSWLTSANTDRFVTYHTKHTDCRTAPTLNALSGCTTQLQTNRHVLEDFPELGNA